jgi:hypothetical protein
MIWIAALYISLSPLVTARKDVLKRLILYILLITKESRFNLLLGDLTELTGVT